MGYTFGFNIFIITSNANSGRISMLKIFKREESRYTIFMLSGAFFALLKTVTVAKLYSSESFGQYSYIFVIQSFGMYFFTLGINEGLIRELTIANTESPLSERYDQIKNQVTSWGLLLVAVVTPVFWFLVSCFLPLENKGGLLVTFLAIVNSVFNILSIDLKAKGELVYLATVNFCKIILAYIVIFPLYLLGCKIEFLLVGEGLIILFFSIFIWKSKVKINFNLSINGFERAKKIALIGLPFNFVSLLRMIGSNIDKITAAAILSSQLYGSYSFLMIGFSVAITIQGVIGSWFQPKIIAAVVEKGRLDFYFNKALKLQIAVIMIALAISYPFYLFVHFLVLNFFPKYELIMDGVVFTWLGSALAATTLYDSFAISLGRGRVYTLLNTLLIIFYTLAVRTLYRTLNGVGIFELSMIFMIYQLLQSVLGCMIYKISSTRGVVKIISADNVR